MPGIGIGISPLLNRGGGTDWSSYWTTRHTELSTYITGLITPLSDAQIIRLGIFMEAIKTGMSITNLSDAFDLMYILAGETAESSLRNLVKNAHHATAVNSPTFTAFEGFLGGGASQSLTNDYNLQTSSVTFTQNSASLGVYVRTNNKTGLCLLGCRNTTEGRLIQLNDSNGTNAQIGINRDISTSSRTLANSSGFLIGVRTSDTNEQMYHNGSPLGTAISKVSVGLPNSKLGILRYGKDDVYDGTSCNEQISFVFSGRSLNSDDVTALTNAIENYMDANGKGVI